MPEHDSTHAVLKEMIPGTGLGIYEITCPHSGMTKIVHSCPLVERGNHATRWGLYCEMTWYPLSEWPLKYRIEYYKMRLYMLKSNLNQCKGSDLDNLRDDIRRIEAIVSALGNPSNA